MYKEIQYTGLRWELEAPTVIQSYYNKRIVDCPGGGEGEDEQDVVWFWMEKGNPHECPVCTSRYCWLLSSMKSFQHQFWHGMGMLHAV
nr:unnamed protein product [Digitaria exilis]